MGSRLSIFYSLPYISHMIEQYQLVSTLYQDVFSAALL